MKEFLKIMVYSISSAAIAAIIAASYILSETSGSQRGLALLTVGVSFLLASFFILMKKHWFILLLDVLGMSYILAVVFDKSPNKFLGDSTAVSALFIGVFLVVISMTIVITEFAWPKYKKMGTDNQWKVLTLIVSVSSLIVSILSILTRNR